MRVLLDENMPLTFGALLPGLEVAHIEEIGLKGIANGALLSHARSHFDAFVIRDKGILFEHDHRDQRLIIVVVRSPNSKVEVINRRAEEVLIALLNAAPGSVVELPWS